jgi:hypothetical protein
VGVPLMRMVSELNVALTPDGKPVGMPMPVAPVVVCVMVVRAILIQIVGVDDAALVVFVCMTVIVPVAFILPHPPVNGML